LVTANGIKDQQQAVPYARWHILGSYKSTLQWQFYTEFYHGQSGATGVCSSNSCMTVILPPLQLSKAVTKFTQFGMVSGYVTFSLLAKWLRDWVRANG